MYALPAAHQSTCNVTTQSRVLRAITLGFHIAACLCTGCDREPASAAGEAVSTVNSGAEKSPMLFVPTTEQVAAMMGDAYRKSGRLEFTADVTHGPHRIHCKMMSTRRAHQLKVELPDGKTIYTMVQVEMTGGNTAILENNLVTGGKSAYVVTPADFDPDRWNARHTSSFGELEFDGCLFGAYQRRWLGRNAHQVEFWSRTIVAGRYDRNERLDGVDCFVVATLRQRPDEEIWIDRETGLVMRWRDSVRDRVYRYQQCVIDE